MNALGTSGIYRTLTSRKLGWISFLAFLAQINLAQAAQPDRSHDNESSDTEKWNVVAKAVEHLDFRGELEKHLPFRLASTAGSTKHVFVYYFPFFLASMDNQPVQRDHWATQYLQRDGENGKYRTVGGFTRERPLTQGPWNTPYWRQINETRDVLEARALGIDGFIVGLQQLSEGGTLQISRDVCSAAARFGEGFKIIASPDGAVLKGTPVSEMVRLVKSFQTCPATFHLSDGSAVLAPFGAQNETPAYWKSVVDDLAGVGRLEALVPILLDPVKNSGPFQSVSVGLSHWGSRDPLSAIDPTLTQALTKARSSVSIWMQPITTQDMRPKDAIFWEARNTEAFRAAWMKAISDDVSWIDLITWNDYSEATEIEPSSGTQFLFYDLAAYYISWFRSGHAPEIMRDAIFYSHRNQILKPDEPLAQGDKPFTLLGKTPLSNEIEMIAFLTQPATLQIEIAGQVHVMTATAGLATMRIPASAGRPEFRILRGDKIIVKQTSYWEIEARPAVQSPLYLGGSSTRQFRSAGDEIGYTTSKDH